MRRVVIDTNVFISSFFGGNPRQVVNLWKRGEIILCLSQDIVQEYLEVLHGLGVTENEEIHRLAKLFALGHHSVFTSVTPKLDIVRDDPDDDKFLECAVALDAKHIISGDNHLRIIKKYINIHILSPREFLDMMGDRGTQ